MIRSIIVHQVLLSSSVAAQQYVPFIDTVAAWQDYFMISDPGPGITNHECYRYHVEGDTTINDTLYHVLRMTGHTTWNQIEPPYSSGAYWYDEAIVGYLREDTVTRRVFFRNIASFQEVLMYDFSVQTGPYPWTYAIPYTDTQVLSVDIIQLMTGPRRRFNLIADGSEFSIIEGIGHQYQFLPSQSGGAWGMGGLVCHTVDGIPDYEYFNAAGWNCACGSNVGIAEVVATQPSANPSPTTGALNLQGASRLAEYTILNLDGRVVLSGKCTHEGSALIDLNPLATGVYVVAVVDGRTSSRIKVMKE